MTKSKGKAAAVSRIPPPSVGSSSIVISRKYQNISLNKGTGRWQAWTNCMATKEHTRGPYVGAGQHSTQILAARAQDRSLLKHRARVKKQPIWLNFPESDYASDEKLRNALSDDEFIELLKGEARACYTKVERTRCMQMFLEEEQARGNLPVQSEGKAKATSEKEVKSLRDFLTQTFLDRRSKKPGMKHKDNITEIVDDLLRDQEPEDANLQMLATVVQVIHPDLDRPY